jgi:gentisate 1,2-dioxygenase
MPQGNGETPHYSSMFRYPWTAVLGALSKTPAAADGSRKLRYTNPQTGGSAMALIDCYVLALAKGRETTRYRTTSDAICVVADGEGESKIGEHRLTWRRNDIFTMPSWNWITHTAATDDARLFLVTDRDALDRLGMLHDEVEE